MPETRRILTALLVAFAAFVLLLAGTGAAAAGGEGANGLEGSFGVAPSRPGDRAEYTLNMIKVDRPDGDSGWAYDAGARLTVERVGDRVIPVDGVPQVTASFASTWRISDVDWSAWSLDWGMDAGDWQDFADDMEDMADDCEDAAEDWEEAAEEYEGYGDYGDFGTGWMDCMDWLDTFFTDFEPIQGEPWHVAHVAPDGRVVATTRAGTDPGLPGARLARSMGLEPSTTVVTLAGPSSAPCGFHSDLQDALQPLANKVRVQGDCPPAGGHFGTPPGNLTSDRFVAIGKDVVQGRQATVYGHEGGARNLRLWFAADVPYPVRMVVPVFLAKDYPVLLLYEMTQFTPGTLQEGHAPAAPLPVPRLPSGPDATGVEHPFPLAAALQAAIADQQDPSVGQWYVAHPDAAVDEASFVTLREGTTVQDQWTFTLVSGGDAMHVTATRGAPYEGPAAGDQAGAGSLFGRVPPGTVPAPVDDGVVVRGQAGGSGGRIAPAQMPADLPRVADLLALWRSDGAGGGTPAWSFLLRPDGSSWLAVGWAEAVTTGRGPNPNDEGNTTLSYAYYGVGPDGSFRFVEESPARYDVPPEAEAGPSAYDPEDDDDWSNPRGFAVASIGYWAFPETRTTATVTAAAGLIGLLAYALLPAKFGALGLFSRIGSGEVLDHPMRAQIASLVEAEPGIHFQEIVRRLDAGRGTTEHHLRKLLSANVVSAQVAQGFTCYFPKGKVDRHLMAAAPVLKSDGARQVLQCIQEQPGRAALDVAGVTGLTPSTVNYHLKRLVASGLVSNERRGRYLLLTPTPLGIQALGAWGRT